LNRSILDAAWGGLFHKVSYKAENAGRTVRQPPARRSSQECLCGASVPKTLMTAGITVFLVVFLRREIISQRK
jgi:hypothetical protein